MSHILDCPHEILIWIYLRLECITDALHLSRSCRQLHHILNRPHDRLNIFLSIINNIPTPTRPDNGWMKSHFGIDSIWQPTESDFPRDLTDPDTRSFLTTVGFPAMKLKMSGFDSTHLKDRGLLQAFDADELYGLRYPDDDSPPTNFAFHFASLDQWMVMVGGEDGEVALYDPDGWDHADGYQGLVTERLDVIVPESVGDEEKQEEMQQAVLGRLRERMVEYDDCVEECKFWDGVFEAFE
ncbi:hypothetical protein ASPWEDRAFT_244996 [Aspergillus wentii DTO 134E9]|uniref:F-box domain-containing protein n=1 Tax=Aspergillus wentii DTO 134E9 TaxID=1073089 RepID=A0A1L9S1R2_ASPWE|nr:uncharacterized protein ASPWEDRAFT_244996 [Aspergillus wentii DTO 134E9]OJJ41101.1 hypothetical protein ASPWEDRAFT_244996 [Aspergillus wentii DTO 134E9]